MVRLNHFSGDFTVFGPTYVIKFDIIQNADHKLSHRYISPLSSTPKYEQIQGNPVINLNSFLF